MLTIAGIDSGGVLKEKRHLLRYINLYYVNYTFNRPINGYNLASNYDNLIVKEKSEYVCIAIVKKTQSVTTVPQNVITLHSER